MKNNIIRQVSKTDSHLAMGYTLFCGKEAYGISVKNETNGETATIGNISGNRLLTEQLFELLLGGFVTPVTVRDVVEDFVAEH